MSTQKALYIPSKQAPMQIGEAPIYTPGPTDLLVKIMAVGLNPVDWKIQTNGGLPLDSYPVVLGEDVAGDIVQVGRGLEDKFRRGQRVILSARGLGSHPR